MGRSPKRRKTTIIHRKLSDVTANLRSWKSLPDHLEDHSISCWPCEHRTYDRSTAKDQENVNEEFTEQRHLCRASSNAHINYALMRKAIKERNRFDLLSLLNRKGEDINALGPDGLTVLHHAAIAGTRKVIEMLFFFGAKINVKTSEGDFPLDLAVRAGNYDIAQYLIEKGACLDNVVNGTPPRRQKQRKKGRSHTISAV